MLSDLKYIYITLKNLICISALNINFRYFGKVNSKNVWVFFLILLLLRTKKMQEVNNFLKNSI